MQRLVWAKALYRHRILRHSVGRHGVLAAAVVLLFLPWALLPVTLVRPVPAAVATFGPVMNRVISQTSSLLDRCGELAIISPSPAPAAAAPLNRALLVVSAGGAGTSFVISMLGEKLARLGIRMNKLNDEDGLKHPWLSECTLHRVRRFAPTAVVYLLGDPASALHSHFRRGWAAAQLCRLNPSAEAIVTHPMLKPIFDENKRPMKVYKTAAAKSWADFVRWIAAQPDSAAADPFDFVEHARSWERGAAELGAPLWFTTLDDLANDTAPLRRLLSIPDPFNGSFPASLTLRNSSYTPGGLPHQFIDRYARTRDELWALRGRCFETSSAQPGHRSVCATAVLPTVDSGAPAGESIYAGKGTGTIGGDPAYRFLGQTQVRQGSACWKYMKPPRDRRALLVESPGQHRRHRRRLSPARPSSDSCGRCFDSCVGCV